MGVKRTLFFESRYLKVIRVGSKGRKEPAKVVIDMPPRNGGHTLRSLTLSIDDLFDLAEVLDDLCDVIEDAETAQKSDF